MVLPLAMILLGCSKRPPPPGPKRTVLVVYNPHVVIAKTRESVSVVKLTRPRDKSRNKRRAAEYRYRQLIRGEDGERTGTGELFENYASVSTGKNTKTHILDRGQLFLQIGELSLEWSFQSDTSGYLYFYPSAVTIEVRKQSEFESFDLAKEATW